MRRHPAHGAKREHIVDRPRGHLAGLEMEFCIGDLRDPARVREAMAGVRYVFHVAADYRLWARDPDEIQDIFDSY